MRLENAKASGVYAEPVLEESVHMSLESLKVLEGRVNDILSRHAELCAERDRLHAQLQEAHGHIAEMRSQLDKQEKERAQVRARVESILGRLEGLDLS
jgi:chromosome segregation ATPase